jgi:hypothetical protein
MGFLLVFPCLDILFRVSIAEMENSKLLKYAKFYIALQKLELDIRNASDLGHHLNENKLLLTRFDECAD